MYRIYLGALLSLWIWHSAYGADDATLISAPLIEEFRDTLPLSGSVVAGVMVPKASDNAGTAPYAYMPTTTSPLVVCVLVRTRDGRYRSENSYLVPVRYQGFVRFEYPTQYAHLLRSATVDDIAVLILQGECGRSSTSSELFIASWGAPADPSPNDIILSANSGRKLLTVGADSSGMINGECTELTSGVRRVFDSLCHISLTRHLPHVVQITLTEWRAGEPVGNTAVHIRLAF